MTSAQPAAGWGAAGDLGDKQRSFKGWLWLTEREQATGVCVRRKSSVCVICYFVVSHLRGDTQTQLRRVHATAANVSFPCKEGKQSRRPSGG